MNEEFDPSELSALVLDDNAFQRGISIDQLRTMGFRRTIAAGNTTDAWALLCENDPSIVLMEWLDGGQDSLGLVRRIRLSEEAPNRAVPIFMLTMRGAAAEVETARAAGIDGYLRKPVSGLALQRRLRKVVITPQPFIVTASYVGPCRRRKRPSADYSGPWRRLDDKVAEASEAEEMLDLKEQLARASVAALAAATDELAPGNADAARAVYSASQALISAAEQLNDKCLTLGAREMARYVQAVGATERLEPDVVRLHVAALQQLAQLPLTLGNERYNVAESLRRMVDKKLQQVAGAA